MSCPDIDSSGKLLVVNPKDHESIEPSGSVIRGGTSISLVISRQHLRCTVTEITDR
jgi:hypothetical protein